MTQGSYRIVGTTCQRCHQHNSDRVCVSFYSFAAAAMLAPAVGVFAPAVAVSTVSPARFQAPRRAVPSTRHHAGGSGGVGGVHGALMGAVCLPALKLASGARRGVGVPRKAEEDVKAVAEADAEAQEAEADDAVEEEQSKEIQKAKPRQRRVVFDPTAEPGAMAPLGYFDPLGFCPSGDEGKFKQLRAAELKHGRVAMLASVGLVAQCYIRLPFLGLKDSPAGYKAALLVPSLWMFGLVVIGSMLVEWLVWKEDPWKEPGNFGDPLGLGMYDRDMRNKDSRGSCFVSICQGLGSQRCLLRR